MDPSPLSTKDSCASLECTACFQVRTSGPDGVISSFPAYDALLAGHACVNALFTCVCMLAQLNTGTRDGLLRVLPVSLCDMPIFVTQLGRSHIERMSDLDTHKHS